MKTIVISVGGSLIFPDNLDMEYLKELKEVLGSFDEYRFVIYCGGGKLARLFQQYLRQTNKDVSDEALDEAGIKATRINAEIVKNLFGDQAYPTVVCDPTEKIEFKEKVLVAAGWKPGWSTDYDSVLIAKNLGINTILNLTNVAYVYDKNPKKFKDAIPYKEISWKDLLDIVGTKWEPGLSAPFDPIAAKEAEKLSMTVIVMDGQKLDNLKNYLNGKEFIGTIIK